MYKKMNEQFTKLLFSELGSGGWVLEFEFSAVRYNMGFGGAIFRIIKSHTMRVTGVQILWRFRKPAKSC